MTTLSISFDNKLVKKILDKVEELNIDIDTYFAELAEKSLKNETVGFRQGNPRQERHGIFKDRIKTEDNFNDPLDCLKEYM
ncbi:MAG: hypothetical protein LBM93_06840 [Oscillospiraceae bacterium]|jgi:hypothetical protein|nr:hypothetical protein [Oscillospiraceae bacterium]